MAYPPTVPPADITNTTPQVDRHPADHNGITNALRDILNELGTNPSGASATVEARFAALSFPVVWQPGTTQVQADGYPAQVTAGAPVEAAWANAAAWRLGNHKTLNPGSAANAVFAFKYYAAGVLFDANQAGRYDWGPVAPSNCKAVWVMHNLPNYHLTLWNGAVAVGFNNTSVWVHGGPANTTIPFVEFLVLDQLA